MNPRPLLFPAALLCASPALAVGAPAPVTSIPPPAPAVSQVVPGVGYQRLVQDGQVVHVIRASRSGLVALTPMLVGGATGTRGDLAAAVAARSAGGAVVGVNGDFFNTTSAYPSGITVTSGEGLASEPEPTRSALLFGPDGVLAAARLTLTGKWQALDAANALIGTQRTFAGINRPPERRNETLLYTAAFGARTPEGTDRTEAVITVDDGAMLLPNAPVTGVVREVRTGGQTPLQAGTVVLTGAGTAGAQVGRELPAGTRVRIDPAVAGLNAGTLALGGGPLLVDAGAAVPSAGEGFSATQTGARTARTAIGQTADGTYLLVAAEGPAQGSPGITVAQQAALMQRLGARIAVAMDAGGSAQMVVDGTQAVSWTSPRWLTTAAVLTYAGVRMSPVTARLTPNGDGLDDTAVARVTAPQAGRLYVTLTRKGGGPPVTLLDEQVQPGTREITLDPVALGIDDGPYRLTAESSPQGGVATLAGRSFVVDRTLADLRVRAVRERVGKRQVPMVRIAFRLQRPARVSVRVLDGSGRLRRTLRSARPQGAGNVLVLWDRLLSGEPAEGTFRIEVEARTSLGRPGLATSVTLAALPKPRPRPAPGAAPATPR